MTYLGDLMRAIFWIIMERSMEVSIFAITLFSVTYLEFFS